MATRSQKAKRKRFEFDVLRDEKPLLRPGTEGNDVRALQRLLTEMGYLKRDRQPGHFCECTCAALKHLQKCYGLPDTGEADEETLRLLQRPRCGVPDIGPDPTMSTGPAPFVLRGCRYSTNELTYAFINGTDDLSGDREQGLVREALAAWAEVTPLRFAEVSSDDSPDLPISWEHGNHGDGSPFDGLGTVQGNVLAHAFYPPPCGGPFAGALHFDEDESWTDAAAPGRIRLLNVAIHEIGHLLGLEHSNVRDAIMFAFYNDDVDTLRPDDIAGIHALYGVPPAGPTPLRGRLEGDGDNKLHSIVVDRPGPMTVTLNGPAGQDFDLYLRAGQPPTRNVFDARGFSSLPNEEVRLDVTGGQVFILVDSWRGSGDYEVRITLA